MTQDKLWLDDVREPPDDTWFWCKTVSGAIACLEENTRLERASLDHDLGGSETGMQVIDWLITQHVVGNDLWPRQVDVHSQNPPGKARMENTIKRYRPTS